MDREKLRYFCIDLKSFYASVECVERGRHFDSWVIIKSFENRHGAAFFCQETLDLLLYMLYIWCVRNIPTPYVDKEGDAHEALL